MVFGALRRIGGNVLRGIRNVGSQILRPIKTVRDTAKNVLDRARKIPVVGDLVNQGIQMIPEPIRRGIRAADSGIDVADRALSGDLRGAVRGGRNLFNQLRS